MGDKNRIIMIICIAILLSLSLKMIYDSSTFDCESCTITLKNQNPITLDVYEFGTYKISDLFEDYKGGRCPIVWVPEQGYANG